MSTVASTQASISEWLRSFQIRQSWLSCFRGGLLGLLTLLVGASIVMLLDAIGLLPDGLRWGCTIIVYILSLVTALAFGIVRPFIPSRRTRLANDVESLCPEVREQLLACVELDTVRPQHRNFSEAFLTALEDRVSHALRERSIHELLPLSQLRVPFMVSAISLCAIAALYWVPSLDMPLRLQRALLPFVEIERPSRTRIDVIKPQRSLTVVPENQAVEFEIQLSGIDADSALMEWRSHEGLTHAIFEVPVDDPHRRSSEPIRLHSSDRDSRSRVSIPGG
jgi:hypothetical protein